MSETNFGAIPADAGGEERQPEMRVVDDPQEDGSVRNAFLVTREGRGKYDVQEVLAFARAHGATSMTADGEIVFVADFGPDGTTPQFGTVHVDLLDEELNPPPPPEEQRINLGRI